MQKILLLNNDLDLLDLLKTWLERKNYKVKYTTSHNEALTIIRQFQPQLVMADVMQAQALLQFKKSGVINNIPVLLMSGYTGKRKNEQYAADDYIEKPFDLPLLELKMQRLLNKTGIKQYAK